MLNEILKMEISERDQYLIDKYLRGQLQPSEKNEFNGRLNDSAFRERLDLHRDLLDIIMTEERIATKTLLRNWDKEEDRKKPLLRRIWLPVAVAAAVALMLIFFWPESDMSQELFTRYYTHFPDAISQTTRASSQGGQSTNLMLPYNKKDWSEAIGLMHDHLQKDVDDHAIRLYYALSLLNAQKTAEAIPQLEIVKNNAPDPDFQSAARWYQALCYVRLNQKKKVVSALEYMIGQDHYQSQYARELLEKVKAN